MRMTVLYEDPSTRGERVFWVIPGEGTGSTGENIASRKTGVAG